VEASPATAYVALANLQRALALREQKGGSSIHLLPFALVNQLNLETYRVDGGLCLRGGVELATGNVGAQAVDRTYKACTAASLTGAALLQDALRALAPPHKAWPSVYIMKMDIQEFEHTALLGALDWLREAPPCYIIAELEMNTATEALVHLLVNVGYDQVWLATGPYMGYGSNNITATWPPLPPLSTVDGTHRTRDFESALRDAITRTIASWMWIDAVFSFSNHELCVQRLSEQSKR